MNEIIEMVCEMSPYLLLGFFIAGLMHSFVPSSLFRSYLSGSSFRSVFYAALLGIPIPLCSCGVIPTALSLHKEGASKGASVSFLIATPQTGVDSIAATYSLMGLPFAILRPLVALITAIIGGHVVNVVDDQTVTDISGSNEHASCCCSHSKPSGSSSFLQKLKSALHYAFVEMMAEIGKWLVVGLVIAGLLTAFLPDDFLSVFSDRPVLGMVFVLLLSIPMYVCATGSIPIAVALMLKGLSPGAALVLLMAGPAVNMASILVIRNSLGLKTLVVYLLSIIGGAMAFGLAVDYLMPREWFQVSSLADMACHHENISVLGIVCAVALILLLLNVLRLNLCHKAPACCCHEHSDNHHECHCHEHHEEHHECHCHEHHEEHHECHCHEHEEEHHECHCHEHEEEHHECHCHEHEEEHHECHCHEHEVEQHECHCHK
ncbi:MAG: SO_0444 family Cu/Zn efflux transporter [Bacteroidales bacterium]|nr:SO_0444 family Cu/Zn efflux transporter [Bacteroidales bacterium]